MGSDAERIGLAAEAMRLLKELNEHKVDFAAMKDLLNKFIALISHGEYHKTELADLSKMFYKAICHAYPSSFERHAWAKFLAEQTKKFYDDRHNRGNRQQVIDDIMKRMGDAGDLEGCRDQGELVAVLEKELDHHGVCPKCNRIHDPRFCIEVKT